MVTRTFEIVCPDHLPLRKEYFASYIHKQHSSLEDYICFCYATIVQYMEGGREGGREGEREGGREGGREAGKEAGKKAEKVGVCIHNI